MVAGGVSVVAGGLDGSSKSNKEQSTAFVAFQAKFINIYLLGMGLTLNGCMASWNTGLRAGFFGYLLCLFVSALVYGLLAFCQAEMISIVAFGGGSYGFIRATLGPFWGYLAACSEWIQNNFYTVSTIRQMGQTITFAFQTPQHLEPLWFFLFYCATVSWHTLGGRYFWYVMGACATISSLIIAMYLLGIMAGDPAIYHYSYINGEGSQPFTGGFNFMESLMRPFGVFIGIETIGISAAKMSNGREVIPKAQIAVYLTTLILIIWISFLAVAESNTGSWSDFLSTPFEMDYGFKRVFGIPMRYAALLTIIPNYACALGFIYASKHLTQAMALSGLLPAYFQKAHGKNKIPIRALLTCASIQLVALVIVWSRTTHTIFFGVTIIGISICFLFQFMAFIVFRYRYENMERLYYSPFGVPGAVLGMVVVMLPILAALGFQPYSRESAATYFIFIFAMIIYYFAVAEKRQFFSPEEQRKFMKAYIVNANKRKKLNRYEKFMLQMKYVLSLHWLLHIRSNFFDKASTSNMGTNTNNNSSSPKKTNTTSAPSNINSNQVASITAANNLTGGNWKDEEALEEGHVHEPKGEETRGALKATRQSFAHNAVVPDVEQADQSVDMLENLAWSGKIMNTRQSAQFFQILTASEEDGAPLATKLIETLPDQFTLNPRNSIIRNSVNPGNPIDDEENEGMPDDEDDDDLISLSKCDVPKANAITKTLLTQQNNEESSTRTSSSTRENSVALAAESTDTQVV